MIRGLPASIAFHAALVGATYIAWPFATATRATQTELVSVPVELVELGEITNIAAVRKIEPDPEAVPEEPVVDESETPVEPEDDPVDETLPVDEIETAKEAPAPEPEDPEDSLPDLDKLLDEIEEKPEPEKTKPEPKVPPKPKRDALDDFLSAADSTFESERETRKSTPPPKTPQTPLLNETPPAGQTSRSGAGARTGNTARLEALMYSYVKTCWQGVDDQPNPEKLNVRMTADLDTNGNLIDLRLIEPARRPLGRDPMGIAVDRALRAVRKCAPYKLPKDDYSEWKEIKINLGPAFEPD